MLYANKGKRISPKTLTRYASHFIPLWGWANTREQFAPDTANPFAKIAPKPKRKAGTYLPLEPAELQALFGSMSPQTWLWEIGVVGLYSGMRANEICSLEWADIRKAEGVWYFDITEAKSEAGVRKVPVHSRLAWLLERRPKKGGGQVWPELKPGGLDDKYSHYYSKRFTEWRRKCGITGDRKVFHSLRKNAVQCLERARVQQSDAAQVIGHEQEGITYETYSPHGLTMKQRRDIVEKMKYPGLKLPKAP